LLIGQSTLCATCLTEKTPGLESMVVARRFAALPPDVRKVFDLPGPIWDFPGLCPTWAQPKD